MKREFTYRRSGWKGTDFFREGCGELHTDEVYFLFCLLFQLKTSVDQQIKAKDEELAKKMGISADATGPPKSPKPKGKKGKWISGYTISALKCNIQL